MSGYIRFEQILVRARSFLLLLIRLYWGWQFAQTGWGKLTGLDKVIDFFGKLGVPAPGIMAPAIAGLELVGGILLTLGLGTRAIGLLLAGNMIVAYILSDREALQSVLSNPGKFYGADPFTFLFASVLVTVLGAGAFSLDYLLAGKRETAC